jgi:K+-transporting ATPase ATPase A chain
MWTLPILILVVAIAISIPLSRYMAWILDGRFHAPRPLRWFESKLDSGPQDWKQYTIALLVFNAALFVFGFVVLSLQPLMPLNPLGRGMLAPSTIFNTVIFPISARSSSSCRTCFYLRRWVFAR